MPYTLVLRGSLVQALACGLIFAVLGFSRTAFLSAGLITFVSVWLGFLCARLFARCRKPSDPATIVLTVIAGMILGGASAFAFCCAIEVLPLPPFLFFGAWWVGIPLGLLNVRSWRKHGLV